MAFFLWCSAMMVLGRRVGWALSRTVLYKARSIECVVYCVAWGIVTAWGLRGLIAAHHPGIILKIYGYGAGAYVATPNFGLIDESTIPQGMRERHFLIAALPSIIYIVASVLFAFGIV